jgi:hypothetical protein
MKRHHCYISVPLAAIILLHANTLFAATPVEVISLQADNFEHIQFKRIKANRYTFQQQLQIDVDNSASILMLPFETVKQLNKVSFEWRSEGGPLTKDSQHELKRNGDDAVFKFPFIPSWLKQVRKQLKFPSEEMIYLVADAKHAPGERWTSPYNRRVTMISVESRGDGSGWQQSSNQFEQSLDVVALWLMADGDNTHATFTVSIKNIVLEKSD